MATKKARQALGRGLSSLIPVNDPEGADERDVSRINIDLIKANPFQPRIHFNTEEIENLSESIKSQGLLQPIVLRKKGKGYEIISGERRFRALKHLGEKQAPAIVKKKISDGKMLEMALVENVQREDLNDVELAKSYQKLLVDCGLSHQDLSERIGKSRSAITNTIRLLKLPDEIQGMVQAAAISTGHARALLSVKEMRAQVDLAKKIVSQGLSVRAIENITQGKSRKEKGNGKSVSSASSAGAVDPDVKHQEDRLRFLFGTDVKIKTSGGNKGKIEINYYSQEDLNRILDICRK